jgi:hypothetical protein
MLSISKLSVSPSMDRFFPIATEYALATEQQQLSFEIPLPQKPRGLISLDAIVQPLLAEVNALRFVHVEQPDGSSASRRDADNLAAAEDEVILPQVLSRIVKWHQRPGLRIDTGEIGALVCVASVARKR